MSRYRHVSGNIRKITHGNHTMYSGEDINTSSLGKIQEKGEQGIVYGEPEKYVPSQPENSVNLHIGMFFDGTGNNRENSDQLYYRHVGSGEARIPASTIPPSMNLEVQQGDKKAVINVSDRDSYWNPYSNIAKLYDLYETKTDYRIESKSHPEFGTHLLLKQYVQGIGTLKSYEDDILGSGMGRGSRGIIAKVENGISDLIAQIKENFPKDKKINKLVFDVFGFSRGAGAARHFCNEIVKPATYVDEMKPDRWDPKFPLPTGRKILSQPAGGLLGKSLQNLQIQSVYNTYDIEIRFLGIFDTVVSDMIVKEHLGYKAGASIPLVPGVPPILSPVALLAEASLANIKTNITGLGIRNVYHIVAQNEWRENFALTPSRCGRTFSLPGSHSDIGGGYAQLDAYEAVVDFFDLPPKDIQLLEEKKKLREFYINSGFCTEEQIRLIKEYDLILEQEFRATSDFPISRKKKSTEKFPDQGRITRTGTTTRMETKISSHYVLKDSRYISNKYALVPMYLMLEEAREKGVPFYKNYQDSPDVKKKFEYFIPETENYRMLREYLEILQQARKENKTATLSGQLAGHIYNNYLHLSDHYGGLSNDYLTVTTGEHHPLGRLAFVNHPVPYTLEDGYITYKRPIYEPK